MDVFQAIQRGSNYRGSFKKVPLPERDLQKIVQAGLDAPSGRNLQTTEIVIITEPEQLAAIRAILPGRAFIETAPAFIATIFEVRAQPVSVYSYTFEVEANAAVTESLLLAITALGYASVWLERVLRLEERAQRIARVIGLPASKRVRVLLPVGAPAEESARRKKNPLVEHAWFNRYGGPSNKSPSGSRSTRPGA